MTNVVALVDDLMDRSRITAAVPATVATRSVGDVAGADVVIVDLARHAGAVAEARQLVPDAFLVAFGRHDDTATLTAARDAGADRVLSRAKFFADVTEALRPSDQ